MSLSNPAFAWNTGEFHRFRQCWTNFSVESTRSSSVASLLPLRTKNERSWKLFLSPYCMSRIMSDFGELKPYDLYWKRLLSLYFPFIVRKKNNQEKVLRCKKQGMAHLFSLDDRRLADCDEVRRRCLYLVCRIWPFWSCLWMTRGWWLASSPSVKGTFRSQMYFVALA